MATLVITHIEPVREPGGQRVLRVQVAADCTSDEQLEEWRALVGKRVTVTPV